MHKHTRPPLCRAHRPRFAFLAVLACLLLASCGNSHDSTTASSEVIARVGAHAITRASVEHWMSVMVITDDNDIPEHPDAKRIVPEPPAYTACIANGKTTLKNTPRAQIKQKCALLHQALQGQALEYLISTQQLFGESAERQIAASGSEVAKRLDALTRSQFPRPGAYDEYLRITGRTVQDQFERVKSDLLSTKLTEALTGTGPLNHLTSQQHARLASFARTAIKWKSATTCKPGYIVALCSHADPTTRSPTPDRLIVELGL